MNQAPVKLQTLAKAHEHVKVTAPNRLTVDGVLELWNEEHHLLHHTERNARQTMLALNTLADLGVTIWDYSTGLAVDLDSFEGEMMAFMKARFTQQYREQVRKHTRDAMRRKAEQGHVTGGKVFGYDNVRVAKGQVTRKVNEAEAAIVRNIYARFAAGDGARSIAGALNRTGVPSPRAQQGRPHGWSAATVRAVLKRSLYRGEVVYGRSAKAYGRELGEPRFVLTVCNARRVKSSDPRTLGSVVRCQHSGSLAQTWPPASMTDSVRSERAI